MTKKPNIDPKKLKACIDEYKEIQQELKAMGGQTQLPRQQRSDDDYVRHLTSVLETYHEDKELLDMCA